MSRYFSKRLIAINLLAIIAIGTCAWLSHWQWSRAHYTAKVQVTNGKSNFSELSPLRDYLPPSSVGIPTTVSGTWQESGRLVFSERPVDGTNLINPTPGSHAIVSWAVPIGSWIVDILKLEDGSSLAVVRGWSQTPEKVATASGSANLTGVLQPSEDAPSVSLLDLPSYLTTNKVLAASDSTVHDGYLVSSTATPGLELVKPIFDTPMKVELHWRNVVYTFNWIIFGLIIFGMWWRIIQDELKETTGKNNDR